jgi:hypothetical protein
MLGRSYDPAPTYPTPDSPRRGWREVCADLPTSGSLALDGPMLLDWDAVVRGVGATVAPGTHVRWIDMREQFASWEQVQKRTAAREELRGDPDFATIPSGMLADLFDDLPAIRRAGQTLTVVYGPGASLLDADVLWYVDLPKRYAEAAVTAGAGRNLGAADATVPTTRRLFYIDWPLLDRHRDQIAARVDRWVDTQAPDEPTSLDGATVRATLAALTTLPFRTRPTFNSTSWGGHWAQDELGFNPDAPNTALGYELIAPESGLLLGRRGEASVEVPFQLMVGLFPRDVLGADVHERFGTSFPIRFDYLDTVGGGSLSVHCHPQETYMREVFGWSYTQHETYYVMVGSPDNVVYLGLRDGVDVEEFSHRAHAAADDGAHFEIDQYVQAHPAMQHQLFLIPAGTPHGSGKGNVVLEISATPYLYSLRFYDWLRRDPTGRRRPVHVEHAFRNLDAHRTGAAVGEDLIQQPRTVRSGPGWREDLIGSLDDMFFRVHRLELGAAAAARQLIDGRFHILNLVAGDGAVVETDGGAHELAFAESIVIPAAAGDYTVRSTGGPVRVVKAYVA